MENSKTVYSVMTLIYRFAKGFGMAPHVIRNKRFSSTCHLHAVGFVSLTIALAVCTIMLYGFTNIITYKQEQNFFSQKNIILYILSAMRVFSAIVTVISLFFKQDQFIEAYEKLSNFDEKKKLFSKSRYDRYYNATAFLIFFIFGLVLAVEAMYYFAMEEKFVVIIYDLLSNGLQFVIHLLVLLYFELYTVILSSNFKFIKSTTEHLNKNFKTSSQSEKEILTVVKTVSLMYDDLCKGAESINQVFSFPLFALISLNFMEVLLGIYLLQDEHTRDVKAIFWTTFYSLQQFCILTPPGTTESEAKEITKYLSEAELHADEDLSNERNHFLLRTLHQSVSFTACGFFPISMSAIIGQFSISISFLLFMFQIIK